MRMLSYSPGSLLRVLILILLVDTGYPKPTSPSTKPSRWCGKSIAVVTLLYDDESVGRGDLCGMIAHRLRQSDIPVVAEAEDADWVVIPTAGKILEASPFTSANSVLDMENALKTSASIPNPGIHSSTLARAGLLLTLYRASDWKMLTSGGRVPTPLWMGYREVVTVPQSTNACLTLVDQVVCNLLHWNGEFTPESRRR